MNNKPSKTKPKQTQSNPILPAMAGKIALPVRHSLGDGGSVVEGFMTGQASKAWGFGFYFVTTPVTPADIKEARLVRMRGSISPLWQARYFGCHCGSNLSLYS